MCLCPSCAKSQKPRGTIPTLQNVTCRWCLRVWDVNLMIFVYWVWSVLLRPMTKNARKGLHVCLLELLLIIINIVRLPYYLNLPTHASLPLISNDNKSTSCPSSVCRREILSSLSLCLLVRSKPFRFHHMAGSLPSTARRDVSKALSFRCSS